MSDPTMAVPAALRDAMRKDFNPVRPLLPPRARAAAVVFSACAGAILLFLTFGVRHDLPQIPLLAFWIPLGLRIVCGIALVTIAVREAIPGLGISRPARYSAVAIALSLLFALPIAFARVLGDGGGEKLGAEDLFCYQVQAIIAAPAFLVAWLLVARGFPLRPFFAMIAAGLGTGLLADAALFAACSLQSQKHWLIAHSGSVLTYAMLGAAAGAITNAIRRRRLAE